MAKYYLTNKAVNDLSDIWDYTIETWSEMQAEKYYNLLLATCDDLANNPELGRNYDIITKGILGFKSGEHIIFYSIISKSEIEVERILHGMMDLKSRL
ncbi:type II toxin-antitoxin system RelE/ParE family toxin [Flavobacterium sp. TMP13]|uniref:type II toxin-antitoxin system RelE/ParE family toxin n=1 Tax=Flavobacterium sp. TMP13 TaxID=3425950 RepID=UPI003D788717